MEIDYGMMFHRIGIWTGKEAYNNAERFFKTIRGMSDEEYAKLLDALKEWCEVER